LNRFQKQSRLAKICLEVIAHTLSDEQVDSLRREFAKFDPQGIGEISLSSFRTALEQNRSFSRPDIDYIFDGIDFSKNKTIQYHEFIAAALSQKQITERDMRCAFDIMSNHTGKITLESLQDIIGHEEVHLGPAEDIMREEQLSPTKSFGFEEFSRIMRGTGTPLGSPKNRKDILYPS
jgi:Ca2+-binding EF-hand superfamily protein